MYNNKKNIFSSPFELILHTNYIVIRQCLLKHLFSALGNIVTCGTALSLTESLNESSFYLRCILANGDNTIPIAQLVALKQMYLYHTKTHNYNSVKREMLTYSRQWVVLC